MSTDAPGRGPDGQGQVRQIDLHRSRVEWLRGEGRLSDVVLSSRVRLARNLAGFPFPNRASRSDRVCVLDLCRDRILNAGLAERMLWIDLHHAAPIDRSLLVERHLISKQHAKGKLGVASGGPEEPRGVAVAMPHEQLSIMVNEEDHLRIQVMRTGFDLADALREADEVDDKIERRLDYAFSPRFGYLTACPTNVGTGARFSVMLHLPALKMANEIDKVKRAAGDMALAIRGFYGEGSEAVGDFYQLSNQTTLGKAEHFLLHDMEHEIIPRVVEYERLARRQLVERRGDLVADQAYRALGVLRHARLMSSEEAMECLSRVRLGAVLGLMPGIDHQHVTHLMLVIQPAHLQRLAGREMNQAERRAGRADLLRRELASVT
ncbi:MAG: protein arginine kinase [Phycisphaeraceae bacterium]|nr:protein arginine kinase [Phycisphaeraceae bacterium]MCW5754504.1 protein arginine kinase [Phycisphaeraceae bacterium]